MVAALLAQICGNSAKNTATQSTTDKTSKKPNIQFFSFFLSSIHLGGFYCASRRRRRRRRRRRVDPAAHAPEWLQPLTRVTLTDAAAADLSLSLSLSSFRRAKHRKGVNRVQCDRAWLIEWMKSNDRSFSPRSCAVAEPHDWVLAGRRAAAPFLLQSRANGSNRPEIPFSILTSDGSSWFHGQLYCAYYLLCKIWLGPHSETLLDATAIKFRNSSGCKKDYGIKFCHTKIQCWARETRDPFEKYIYFVL